MPTLEVKLFLRSNNLGPVVRDCRPVAPRPRLGYGHSFPPEPTPRTLALSRLVDRQDEIAVRQFTKVAAAPFGAVTTPQLRLYCRCESWAACVKPSLW